MKKAWCIPPRKNARFVAAMEDVLSVYARPHDPKRPLICLDEGTKQLLKEIQTPVLPAPGPAPGQVAHFDYEYERNGTASWLT